MAKYISPGNISKYAIKPVSSSDGTLVYKNLTGNYVFIAFNSQKPLMAHEFVREASMKAYMEKISFKESLIKNGIEKFIDKSMLYVESP